jgi:Transcriptional regulators
MKKVLLKDIAKHLNVSIPLVSYVLNGKAKEARVSDEMARKIKALAEKMQYRPNQVAKSLKSGKTNTIGLLVADISNPFFSQMARIIEDEAAKYGYIVVFGSSDENAEKSAKLIDVFANHQVDVIIIAPAERTEKQLTALKEKGIPVIMIDRCLKLDIDAVGLDNEEAAIKATNYLINKGFNKIGMVAYDTSLPHMQSRVKGYKNALQKAGIRQQQQWLQAIDFNAVYPQLKKSLKIMLQGRHSVEAIFFATNTLAAEGLKIIKQMEPVLITTPSIVAFDQSDMYDVLDQPPVYIKQPLEEMGKKAVQLAMERIGQPSKKKETIHFQASIIENGKMYK